jgi:hypothetical protein
VEGGVAISAIWSDVARAAANCPEWTRPQVEKAATNFVRSVEKRQKEREASARLVAWLGSAVEADEVDALQAIENAIRMLEAARLNIIEKRSGSVVVTTVAVWSKRGDDSNG